MENGAAMKLSLEAGKPVPVIEEPSLADSLGGGIGLDNQYTFQLVRDLVDETYSLAKMKLRKPCAIFLKHNGSSSKVVPQLE